jgi:hypothetical protein
MKISTFRSASGRTLVLLVCLSTVGWSAPDASDPVSTQAAEIASLRMQLAAQQVQLEQLRNALEAQKRLLDRLEQSPAAPAAATVPVPASQALVDTRVLAAQTATTAKNLAGFQFSGDFRFRADVQARSGNEFAPPLQNIRSRYRVRLNVDKELDPRFKFHLQLSTGPLNNSITNDQDMAGLASKAPFSISEAWVDFHPGEKLSIRGGRLEEAFADNQRFLWDDDVRFNGFQQTLKLPMTGRVLGLRSLEFRAGEYILTNPAIYAVPALSPFVSAGYRIGGKVRAANLFHPGLIARGDLGRGWTQQFMGGLQLYRNPNQILLASTSNGFPVLVSNAIGLVLSSAPGGAGTATTQPGGAMFHARDFQIVHLGWRLERRVGPHEAPFWMDFQGSRNVGTGRLRDAFVLSANLGSVKKALDMRFLYQYAIKDANSMISQFTDDDLGTGSGVNIAVHGFRFDLGLTRFLQFQHLLFLQDQRRANNPSDQFFVPLQRGANTTFRYLGQLAFTF